MLSLPPSRNWSANFRSLKRCVFGALFAFMFLVVNGSVTVLHAKQRSESERASTVHNKTGSSVSKRVADAATADRDLPTDQQVKPASVTLAGGQLTVRAENSDLAQILDKVSKLSGMQVSGQGSRAHVFGVYGPGSPQSVLTKLLTGSGYNFLMVGRTTVGTPRQLLLMAKTDVPEPTQAAVQRAAAMSSVTPEPNPENAQPGAEPNPSASSTSDQDQEPLGPGAIANVPPSEQPANQEDPQTRMQQHLQQLQQQFQEQQQQQPQ